MKIVNLQFKNINNLKGEHLIDFTKSPLLRADIFAILGPTGSGKSSILDVITIALFNRTPRFKKLSKKELVETGSIVTQNEKEAYAQIVYEVKGKQYISKWSISSNRNNKFRDYEMEVFTDGRYVDLKKSEVPDYNHKIIGLDYEQFTKAIILSQGDFAKFLKADADKRSELLEKITGTAIYRELGIKTHEVHREKKAELENVKLQLETITVLSDDELSQLKKTQKESESKLEIQGKSILALEEKIAKKKEFTDTKNKLEKLYREKELHKESLIAFTKELEKLELHKKVVPFRGELQAYVKLEASVKANENKLVEKNKALKQQHDFKVALIAKLKTILKDEVAEENFISKSKVFEDKVRVLESELEQLLKEGGALGKDIEALCDSPFLKSYQFDSKVTALRVTEVFEQVKNQLAKHNYTTISEVVEVEKDILIIEKKISDFKELKLYHKRVSDLEKEVKEFELLIKDYKKQLELFPHQFKTLETKEEIALLEVKKLKLQLKISSLEEYRKELKQDEECPLCGAKEHPFADENLPEGDSIVQELEKVEQLQKILQKQVNELKTQEKLLVSKIELQEKQVFKNKNTIQELKEQAKLNIHNKNLFDEVVFESVENELPVLEKQKVSLDSVLKAFQKITPLEQLLKKIEEVTILRSAYSKMSKQKNDLYPKKDITVVMSSLQTEFNKVLSNLAIHKNSINELGLLINKEKEEFTQISKQIELVKQKTEMDSIALLQSAILSDELLSQMEAKEKLLAVKTTELDTLLKQTNDKFNLINKDEVQNLKLDELIRKLDLFKLDRDSYIGAIAKVKQQIIANQETLKKQQKFIQIYNKANKEYLRWAELQSIIGDGKGKKFSSFAQSLTLQQLIAFTNKRLKTFSGRYVIFTSKETEELMIVDQLQGNTVRSVRTLSGGEAFLISLALALSLSDMASKNIKLESLFIDEGFGTLDSDTLENAMGLLDKLQTESSKKVGVISHVRELQERINVQIQLKKNSQGHSSISIVEL